MLGLSRMYSSISWSRGVEYWTRGCVNTLAVIAGAWEDGERSSQDAKDYGWSRVEHPGKLTCPSVSGIRLKEILNTVNHTRHDRYHLVLLGIVSSSARLSKRWPFSCCGTAKFSEVSNIAQASRTFCWTFLVRPRPMVCFHVFLKSLISAVGEVAPGAIFRSIVLLTVMTAPFWMAPERFHAVKRLILAWICHEGEVSKRKKKLELRQELYGRIEGFFAFLLHPYCIDLETVPSGRIHAYRRRDGSLQASCRSTISALPSICSTSMMRLNLLLKHSTS